ncbi:MAG: hypothetical protein JWO78_2342 [Micavibrio sp.]|nr:hypothetical protein [Micavibrio sp.]
MPVYKTILRISALGFTALPLLALTACGDGYEVKPYYGVPYTHDRTAGHGVEWVRANMMAPKATNTDSLMRAEDPTQTPVKVTPQVVTPPPIADKMFKERQSK